MFKHKLEVINDNGDTIIRIIKPPELFYFQLIVSAIIFIMVGRAVYIGSGDYLFGIFIVITAIISLGGHFLLFYFFSIREVIIRRNLGCTALIFKYYHPRYLNKLQSTEINLSDGDVIQYRVEVREIGLGEIASCVARINILNSRGDVVASLPETVHLPIYNDLIDKIAERAGIKFDFRYTTFFKKFVGGVNPVEKIGKYKTIVD